MSETIKCIILDDEKLAIDTLKWQLKEFCDGIEIIETFTNPVIATDFLKNNQIKIDICFLDIEMPEMNGFEFLNEWKNSTIPFDVIFTTAYNEFAVQAFRANACDYLLKPIDEDDLMDSIQNYREKYHNHKDKENLANQIQTLAKQLNYNLYNLSKEKISLPTSEGIHIVPLHTIIRLEADKNYTHIFCKENKKILISKTIKELEINLNPSLFVRIHQSHIVNLDCIMMYKKGKNGGSIILEDDTLLPVSKARKEDLIKKLGLT